MSDSDGQQLDTAGLIVDGVETSNPYADRQFAADQAVYPFIFGNEYQLEEWIGQYQHEATTYKTWLEETFQALKGTSGSVPTPLERDDFNAQISTERGLGGVSAATFIRDAAEQRVIRGSQLDTITADLRGRNEITKTELTKAKCTYIQADAEFEDALDRCSRSLREIVSHAKVATTVDRFEALESSVNIFKTRLGTQVAAFEKRQRAWWGVRTCVNFQQSDEMKEWRKKVDSQGPTEPSLYPSLGRDL